MASAEIQLTVDPKIVRLLKEVSVKLDWERRKSEYVALGDTRRIALAEWVEGVRAERVNTQLMQDEPEWVDRILTGSMVVRCRYTGIILVRAHACGNQPCSTTAND